jgi:hypothetical protein
LQKNGHRNYFLQRAAESISRQTLIISGSMRPQIIVGIDPGTLVPAELANELDAEFVTSRGRWAAAALNAAAERIEGEYVAILEDDDQWEPQFLEVGIPAARTGAFVSSNQVEIDPDGKAIRVVDYSMPSGWLMNRDVWSSVGSFNESYRWHHDSEWIGRLNELGHPRVHLVEKDAPEPAALGSTTLVDIFLGRARPKRARRGLLRFSEASSRGRLIRHALPRPLILRQVHQRSGTTLIGRQEEARRQSEDEKRRLVARFGAMPW